ncbi:ATP-binding cassette domain-containing protein [Sphingobacterium sp. DR205]|uniref:iron ABC transporter ATP-binding protein n=1 Tax=Sphingobacterium sp. DR205 TaxID=2713573 RepID=UPI0013E4AA10|nr:ATP-binding cassette domain-containing protein [Sphingobacterium sp. DR205]QIH34237.1 ATP-binding cassette domain-containing protein [Sphingobacterium sp. DR205]
MIEINALNKTYGQRTILKDINLKIPKGKLISLIGPNGAGKSTLLAIIARLEKANRGTVTIDGKEIMRYTLTDFSTKLGFLKQRNNFELKLRVTELIAFGRFPHSHGRLQDTDFEIIDQTIEQMNLSSIRNAFIDEISGGERQRVFLAMVMVQDTDYILLDEPLNNLDMRHAVEIMQVARRLVNEYNKTVIMVVHDINFAANYADVIIGMKGGEISFMDTAHIMMREDILQTLFDIEFKVMRDDTHIICNYYNL